MRHILDGGPPDETTYRRVDLSGLAPALAPALAIVPKLYDDGRVTQALEWDHHLNRLATDKLRLDAESAGTDALPPISGW
ncbi:hypothetical protein AB0J47_18260 [Nocardia sp. NPDC049737]|uniref:hypothetical protein n=1 Tax=Nocardia sp. NPDC049737 TaxID=3154358 RepID=UPI003449A678